MPHGSGSGKTGDNPSLTDDPVSVILGAVSDAVLTTDHRAIIQYANKAVSDLLGYATNELVGQSVKMLLPCDAASRHGGHLDDFRDRGYLDLTGVPRDLVIQTKNGEERHVELVLDPLPGEGKPRFVAILRDLSARDESRKLLEERAKLAASEKRFRDFAECGSDWHWEIDADLRFTYLSPQVEKATGYSPEWHIGHNREELGLDEDNSDLMSQLYQETTELKDFSEKIQLRRRKDGGHVWIAFSGKPIEDDEGNFLGYRGISRDVTEAIERERALKATNSELENFAYVASHDLQEPLRKIMAFGERLSEEVGDDLPERPAMYLDRMTQGAERMSRLINDLLAFSRAGRAVNSPEPIALNDVIAQTLADLELVIRRQDATVEIDDLPVVKGHEAQLYQLLSNLLSNALKFTVDGRSPKVSVTSDICSDWLTLRVTDNGCGFDNEHALRIFELFGRLHGRSEYEGSGLGLAICKKNVECHSGLIEARGEPGEGASFTVRLPAKIVLNQEYCNECAA